MKKIPLLIICFLLVSGCVTRKIHVSPEANKVTAISPALAKEEKCQIIATHSIKDAHPNNVDRELKNVTYAKGGNHFAIIEVMDTQSSRPSSVVAELYNCNDRTAENTDSELLPGAENVKPLIISDMNQKQCTLIDTDVVKSAHADNLETEIANKTYMLGGNRFHITKVIDTEEGKASSVVIDAYRCGRELTQ